MATFNIQTILQKHWHIYLRPIPHIVGPRTPTVACRATNLSDILVHSEHKMDTPGNWLTDLSKINAMYPCGHCQICHFVDKTRMFTNSDQTNTFKIKKFINWSSSKVIYMIGCPCNIHWED